MLAATRPLRAFHSRFTSSEALIVCVHDIALEAIAAGMWFAESAARRFGGIHFDGNPVCHQQCHCNSRIVACQSLSEIVEIFFNRDLRSDPEPDGLSFRNDHFQTFVAFIAVNLHVRNSPSVQFIQQNAVCAEPDAHVPGRRNNGER